MATPNLIIANIARGFTDVGAVPEWARKEGAWVATVSVPQGHYIVDSDSEHCSGRSEQWIALRGELRHITITMNESKVASVDENMYAGAIYGELPTVTGQVEIMSADSPIGEQTRRSAAIDGSSYQLGHLRSGRYVIRIVVGDVVVSRKVEIAGRHYGAAVRADFSPADLSSIVRIQSAGSGFVDLPNNFHEQIQTFRLGAAAVGGWTACPLAKPAEYSFWVQRLSAPVARALLGARLFLLSDSRVPKAFRELSAWGIGISDGGSGLITVSLTPVDSAAWEEKGPQNARTCFFSYGATIVLVVDSNETIREADVCP